MLPIGFLKGVPQKETILNYWMIKVDFETGMNSVHPDLFNNIDDDDNNTNNNKVMILLFIISYTHYGFIIKLKYF